MPKSGNKNIGNKEVTAMGSTSKIQQTAITITIAAIMGALGLSADGTIQ
jgi:hypothetical protein